MPPFDKCATRIHFFVLLFLFSVPPSLKDDTELEAEKRVKKGQSFVIEVPFNAFPRPKVTWTIDNKPIKDKRNFKVDLIDGMTSVSVSKVQPQDAGKLCVVIENDHGKCTQTTKIIVIGTQYAR